MSTAATAADDPGRAEILRPVETEQLSSLDVKGCRTMKEEKVWRNPESKGVLKRNIGKKGRGRVQNEYSNTIHER